MLQLNFGEDRHFIMLSFFDSEGIIVLICEVQLYFWFIVSPKILSDVTEGICMLLQVIVHVQLCFLHMCRCLHFVGDREAPE